MKVVVTYTPIDVEKVVSATADAPGVREACEGMAGTVAGAAGRNLSVYTQPTDNSTRMLQQDALAGVGVKSVEDFVREGGDAGGTIIPVALAVADDWSSRWWEFGSGRRIPATRFMRKALESAPVGSKWRRWVSRGD